MTQNELKYSLSGVKPPTRAVIHIPSSRELRALIVDNIIDVRPSSNHYRPSNRPQNMFILRQNAEGPYDPVIDLNNFIITYGTAAEIEAFKKYLPQLLYEIQEYPVHVTFSIYSKAMLGCLSEYSNIWAALAKARLVIDAEGILGKSVSREILTVNDWKAMSEKARFKLLVDVLGDENRAKVALEYLTSPTYTGVHLLDAPGEAPYGVILVLDIKLIYPLTAEALQKVYKKPYDKYTMIGWVRRPRFLNSDDVLRLVMEAPIVLGRESINQLCKKA